VNSLFNIQIDKNLVLISKPQARFRVLKISY